MKLLMGMLKKLHLDKGSIPDRFLENSTTPKIPCRISKQSMFIQKALFTHSCKLNQVKVRLSLQINNYMRLLN